MSPPKEPVRDDGELQCYRDGELAPADARDVERRVAATPAEQKKLDALDQLGDVVRARYARAADDAGPGLDAVWGKLSRELRNTPAKRGVFAAIGEWFATYRSHVVTGGLAAAMGAAAMFFFARGETKVVFVKTPAPPQMAQNAEVENLDVPSGSGAVFQIAGDKAGEAATTVIWVMKDDNGDADAPGGDKMNGGPSTRPASAPTGVPEGPI